MSSSKSSLAELDRERRSEEQDVRVGRPRINSKVAQGVALLVGLVAVDASLRRGGSGSTTAQVIGHSGGLLMVGFVCLLALRCLGELRAPLTGAQRTTVPAARFTRGEKAAVYVGALVLQVLVLYLAFAKNGDGFGLSAFREQFVERFTTAGDNPHYLYLAEHGYEGIGEKANLIVFYPLYPALVWFVHLVGGSYVVAGLLLSWACWGGACVSVLELAAQRYDRSRAVLASLLLALFPFAFFSMGVYTESLFLLLSAQCLLRLEKRQWIAAGVVGCLAALCRTQGTLLLLPAIYLWLLARKDEKQGVQSLWLALIPAGFGGYLLLNKVVAGSWTAFYGYQGAAPWYQHTRWISANLSQHYEMAQDYPGLAPFIYTAQLVLYFVAMGVLFYGLFSGARVCRTFR